MNIPKYLARILSPVGFYTPESLTLDDAVYVADPELSFIVSRQTVHTRGCNAEGASYSETQWLNPSETRLMGSIAMSLEVHDGSVIFYPYTETELLHEGPDDINDHEWLLDVVKPLLRSKIVESPRRGAIPGRTLSIEVPNRYVISGIPLPACAGGGPYSFRDEGRHNYALARQIFENVELDDHLYIRAMGLLIKGDMLTRHRQFFEEGILTMFILMDLCLNLVQRRLKEIGAKNPTTVDAMNYIHDAFGAPAHWDRTAKWFEKEYYSRRVMSFHPDSRYGVVPHAPLYMDDYYFLNDDLIEILRFLICGYVSDRPHYPT